MTGMGPRTIFTMALRRAWAQKSLPWTIVAMGVIIISRLVKPAPRRR